MISQEALESFSAEEQGTILDCISNPYVIQIIKKQIMLEYSGYGMIDNDLSNEDTGFQFRNINSRIRLLEELADSFESLHTQE